MLLLAFISMDLVRNLYDFQGGTPPRGSSSRSPGSWAADARAARQAALVPGRTPGIRRARDLLPDSHSRGRLAVQLVSGERGLNAGPSSAASSAAGMVPERTRNGWSCRLGSDGPPLSSCWPPSSLGRLPVRADVRLDNCRRLSQTLHSENERLKDLTLTYRYQNRDLTQRAVDDADGSGTGRGHRAAGTERAGLPGRARRAGRGAPADSGGRTSLPATRGEPPCSSGSKPSPSPIPDASSTPRPPLPRSRSTGSSSRRATGSNPRPVDLLKAYAETLYGSR